MKIYCLANARIPTEKAHGLQIMKMCESFANQGINVELIIPRRHNHIKDYPFEFYGIENNFKIKKIFCLDLVKFGRFGFIVQTLIFLFFVKIYSLFRFKKCDIIYTREHFSRLFFKNLIFEDHEPRGSRWIYRFFLKKIRKKVIVAPNLEEFYIKFNINKKSYIVAPNGVDLNEFEKVEKNKDIWKEEFDFSVNDRVILYVGHFYQWKGVYTLLDSAKFLKRDDIKLVLIGGTEIDQKNLSNYIEKEQISNVYVKNFILHKEVIKYLKSADILILPNTAKEERSSKYTTPVKLFEYMASEVPIIASELDSFSRYLKNEKNVLFFQADDASDLARKIIKIIDNKQLSESIAKNALDCVQKYTWRKRARKIINFINK